MFLHWVPSDSDCMCVALFVHNLFRTMWILFSPIWALSLDSGKSSLYWLISLLYSAADHNCLLAGEASWLSMALTTLSSPHGSLPPPLHGHPHVCRTGLYHLRLWEEEKWEQFDSLMLFGLESLWSFYFPIVHGYDTEIQLMFVCLTSSCIAKLMYSSVFVDCIVFSRYLVICELHICNSIFYLQCNKCYMFKLVELLHQWFSKFYHTKVMSIKHWHPEKKFNDIKPKS